MDVTIIGLDDKAVGAAEAVELQHTEEQFTLFCKLPLSVPLEANQSIGFRCVDGRYRIFEITKRDIVEPDGVWEIHAIDKAVRELMDEPVEEQRARNIDIATYAGRLIQDTRFSLGTVSVTADGTVSAYYQSVWSALEEAAEAYGVNIIPYYTFLNGLVSGRYIDIAAAVGEDKGRIFELGDDMTGIRVTYDDSNIKTALYGRGRGVEIESEDSDEVSYGRRLTFADVVWSVADGDPVDKPEGQEWVGDPASLAAFGRDGRNRFGFAIFEDVTDAETLLQKTWEQLQAQSVPAISISASVVDTERMMGRAHEAVRLGDPVLVRIPRRKLDIRANVTAIVRDYIHPEATRLTIANATAVTTGTSAGKIMKAVQETVTGVSAKSDVWDRAGEAFDINGALNVMRNQIISTTGNWYTDTATGAIMMVSSDGTKAMMLNGSGWLIANGKNSSGEWNWQTAATGDGIVANRITSGTINTNNITVGGSGTTMTGTSLKIEHSNLSGTSYTQIDQYGLKMVRNGTTVGGFYNVSGTYMTASQALYNPSYPQFVADIGYYSSIGDSAYGLNFKYNDHPGGFIGAYYSGSRYGLGIRSDGSTPLYIDCRNSDIQFIFNYGGGTQTLSVQYIYQKLLSI